MKKENCLLWGYSYVQKEKDQVKRIEADALDHLRGSFHVDKINAFYKVRPEAELQKELAKKSQEALFDNFAGTHVDMLLAQFDEEEE